MIGRADVVWATCIAACAAALALSLWTWGVPLTNDGAAHVFVAYVVNHIDDPRFAPHYEATAPITSRGFHEVQRLLEPVLGWRTAWRVNVIVAAQLWAFGYVAFVVALDARRRWLAPLGFALALNGLFYLGFLPFTYASGLSFLTIAAWLIVGRRLAPSSARGPAAHAALALALFCVACVHVAPAALAGLFLVALALADGGDFRARALRVAALALSGVPAAAVALLSVGDFGATAPTVADEATLLQRVWDAFSMVPAGPPWRCALAIVLCVAGFAGAARRAERRAAVTAVVGFVALLLACTLPRDLSGWQFAGLRTAPFALALLCAVLPLDDRVRGVRVATSAMVAAFVIASLAWSFLLHKRMRETNASALTLLEEPIPGRDWTGVVMGPAPGTWPLQSYAPLFQMHQLFALENGGRVTHGHDSIQSAHHIRALWAELDDAPRIGAQQDPANTAAALRKELSWAAQHELVVVSGSDEDHRQTIEAGFEEVARSPPGPGERVLVARFSGCRGTLRVEGAHAPMTFELGWFPRRSPSITVGHPAGAPAVYELLPLGCGEVWAFATSGGVCEGQTAMGPVRATFTRDGDNTLVCRVKD